MRTGEEAINRGLAKRLQQMSEERARAARAAAAEDEEFSAEFLSMARQVFQMIDKDNSGTLVKAEMSARRVRPSTRARRGSYAIDATRRLPPDPPAASRPSRRTKKLSRFSLTAGIKTCSTCSCRCASRPRSRRWTRTATGILMSMSGAFRSLQLWGAFDAATACCGDGVLVA